MPCRTPSRSEALRSATVACGGSWRGDPPERCLSRKAGIMRCCHRFYLKMRSRGRTCPARGFPGIGRLRGSAPPASLCEGGGPAGPEGENLAIARNISDSREVLSPTRCGGSPLPEGAKKAVFPVSGVFGGKCRAGRARPLRAQRMVHARSRRHKPTGSATQSTVSHSPVNGS